MKLLLKNPIATKLYSGQVCFEQISKFIAKEYSIGKNWNLSFTDPQGDNIMVSSQSDIQCMKQILQGKQFIKLDLCFEEDQETDLNKQTSQKDQKPCKKSKQSKEKKQKPAKMKIERVGHQSKEETQLTNTHLGIKCQQCNISPIVGVRYSCLNCQNYNICEKCQVVSCHEHNFIKMKKPKRQQSLKKRYKNWRKMSKGFLKQNIKKNCETSESDFAQKSKQKRVGPWAYGGEMVKKRRINRLSKVFGGDPYNYLQFVQKTLELQLQDVIATYAKQNKIDLEQKFKHNFERKLQKLSFFFNKSVEEYKEIVQANQQLNFRAIIKLLKEKGLEDYNGQNFKQMRQKLQQVKEKRRQQKNYQKKYQSKEKCQKIDRKIRHKKGNEKQSKETQQQIQVRQNTEESAEKASLKLKKDATLIAQKEIEMKEKGNILIQMKQLFGEEGAKKYLIFIEDNFSIGREAMIEKWIEQQQLK